MKTDKKKGAEVPRLSDIYCKGKIRTTPLAESFRHLFAHLPCNTWVLLRHLHKNLAQKSSRQRCNAIKSGKMNVSDEVRSALCASAQCAVRALRTKKLRFQQQFRAIAISAAISCPRRYSTLVPPRKARSACSVARARVSTKYERTDSAFDRVRITPLQYPYFAREIFAFSTTFSTVKPNSLNSCEAGPLAPKVDIPMISPLSPAYLYQL